MKPPENETKLNKTVFEMRKSLYTVLHSVTQIQIWLVIELTDSESFIFFFLFVCQKLTAIEKKNLVPTRNENFVEILFI